MDKIQNAIAVVENLESKYGLSKENTLKIKEQFDDFKVYIPLIGKFSVGKSALINTILDWDAEICKEDISVKTAIPTEVFYGNDDVCCICHPEKEFVSMDKFMDIRESISTENAEVVKLQLDNEVLERFPSIALVDMPGLDSGYAVHDKAVEHYIKKSMAYVLVFAADELSIPESMEPILNDLNTYDMPMCVVLTKGNRIADSEEERVGELRQSLKKYFGNKDIPVFVTEKETGRVDEFLNYLVQMEEQANVLGKQYYGKKLEPEFACVSNYLLGYIKNMELSLSELDEKKDKLEHDMSELNNTVDIELNEFEQQIPKLINEIAGDVQAALSEHIEEYASNMIHESDVTSMINDTVRNTLTSSYQNRLMKSISKHINKISDAVTTESANYASVMRIDIDKMCGKEISGIGRTAIDAIGLLLGGPMGGAIAHALTGLINKVRADKRKEAKLRAKEQLSNAFQQIDGVVRNKLDIDLRRIAMEIRKTVEHDVALQIESLEKSLNEVIEEKRIEDDNKNNKILEIEADIRELEEIKEAL